MPGVMKESIIAEIREIKKSAAERLLSSLQKLSSQTDLTVSNLDLTKREDQKLILQVALRGKTELEYFNIVDGLFQAHDTAQNQEEKDRLLDLVHGVMASGEENFGIDWH